MRLAILVAIFVTVVLPVGALAADVAAHASSSRPKFPRTVTGTISGSYTAKQGETAYKASWTIKNVSFKLVHVRAVESTWAGYYNVSGGTVTYSESETGPCSYSLQQTFALRPAMPRRNPSTPFYILRNMLGKDSYGGLIQPSKRLNVTETCTYPDQDPSTITLELDVRNLFNSGEKHFRIGQAMKGRYSLNDDFSHSSRIWTWSLTGRR